MKLLSLLVMAALAVQAQAKDLVLRGTVRDKQGQIFSGLTIRCFRAIGQDWERRTTKTDANGAFQVEVPEGRWLIMPDADELVARGYFCVPGFTWEESVSPCPIVSLPPEVPVDQLNPWRCIILLTEPLEFVAVPTRPELAVEKTAKVEAKVRVKYPTTPLAQQVIRRYRIEKSADGARWTPLEVVSLAGTGELTVTDPGSAAQRVCLYRAVEQATLTVSLLP